MTKEEIIMGYLLPEDIEQMGPNVLDIIYEAMEEYATIRASAIEKVHDEDRAALQFLIDGYCSEVELLDRDRHNLRMALLTLLRCFKNTTKTKEQERYCEAANNILQTTGRTRDILR